MPTNLIEGALVVVLLQELHARLLFELLLALVAHVVALPLLVGHVATPLDFELLLLVVSALVGVPFHTQQLSTRAQTHTDTTEATIRNIPVVRIYNFESNRVEPLYLVLFCCAHATSLRP